MLPRRTTQDLLAERRATVQEARRCAGVAYARLMAQVAVIDAELASRRESPAESVVGLAGGSPAHGDDAPDSDARPCCGKSYEEPHSGTCALRECDCCGDDVPLVYSGPYPGMLCGDCAEAAWADYEQEQRERARDIYWDQKIDEWKEGR